jgi:hypothetical protein
MYMTIAFHSKVLLLLMCAQRVRVADGDPQDTHRTAIEPLPLVVEKELLLLTRSVVTSFSKAVSRMWWV